MTITLQDLSLSKLQNTPITPFRYYIGGSVDNNSTTEDGHLIASEGDYRLMFTTSRFTFTLQNGVEIKDGAGWVIFEKINNNLMPINFISAGSGYGFTRDYTYSGIPQQILADVVNTWNSTTEGEEVETTSSIDDRTEELQQKAGIAQYSHR